MGNDTLQSILGSKTVSFHAIFAKAIGSVSAAVMLSQAFFWQEKAKYKDGIEIGDHVFFQKTADDWYDETGLTKEQQLTARKHLRSSGIIDEKLAGLPATIHYRVDIECLVAVINRYLSSGFTVAVNNRNKTRLNPRTGNGKFRQQETVNSGNYNNKVESLEKKGELKGKALSENGKTAITLHTPDQIGDTFLRVVEQVSLETNFEAGKSCSAGPDEIPEKSFPAKQTGKTGKAPSTDRAAEICAELKTTEAIDFFHAIHAAWSEWTDYKRRERKGTYKTAKTEAATIAALAKTVNYNPESGRAAIEHSIAHTYQGIYPPKDAAPAKTTAERYALDDHPVANTPEELRTELSRFYNAHKSEALLDEVQRLAETNYGPERLRSIVTDFCSNRVSRGRHSETFGQHHAALGAWLKRQKGFDSKNETGHQHAGPQSQPKLRSAAPVNYSVD